MKIARIIGGDIFKGRDDLVGPATLSAREQALAKADAVLATLSPGGGAVELERAQNNHKSVVATKRRTEARLSAALAALQQIYTTCKDNGGENCDQRMTVNFVRDVACNAFERATTRDISDAALSALPPAQEEGVKEALQIALEQAREAFDYAKTKDDHQLCEMRYRTFETALAGLLHSRPERGGAR